MPDKYILDDDHNAIPVDLMAWAEWFEKNFKNRVVKQEDIGDYQVSTVFIGIDHNYDGGDPHIFETIIFNKDKNPDYCYRYSTWQEAEEGHEKAVRFIKKKYLKNKERL